MSVSLTEQTLTTTSKRSQASDSALIGETRVLLLPAKTAMRKSLKSPEVSSATSSSSSLSNSLDEKTNQRVRLYSALTLIKRLYYE